MIGTSEFFAGGTRIPFLGGRFFNGTEVQYRKNVVVLGNTAYKLLFEPAGIDPIGKTVRVGSERFEVVGVFDKRPRPADSTSGADDFVVIPYTAYQRIFGLRLVRFARNATFSPMQIAMLPREGVTVKEAMAEIERIMRIRSRAEARRSERLRPRNAGSLPQAMGPDQPRTFFALVVISSIALMVGGIGVMAIMSISVTERTREIGVRKALGARRAEILFQFLMEAAFLTSLGGVLGIVLGSGDRLDRAPGRRVSRFRCRGGRSRSASASRPRSASSSACIRRSKRRGSTPSKRCDTNEVGSRQ